MTAAGRTSPRHLARVLASIVAVLFVLAPSPAAGAEGQFGEGPPASVELVQRHAPIMMLQLQEEPCGPGEPFAPISVEAVLDNPEVALRQVGRGDPVAQWAVEGSDLGDFGAGFYLDSPGHALDPGCLYETDGRRFDGDRPATIYGRVVPPTGVGDPLVVQYWFYWYFNQWNNDHEGDWEGIQLLFDADTAAEALAVGPYETAYAQHDGGEYASWDDEKLEREGVRPVVYSSAGSHASYYESAVFFGRGADTGFGCDDTTGPSRRVDPEVVLLPTDVADARADLAWLAFPGRWGEPGPSEFYDGPHGPGFNPRWDDPLGWQAELRDGSITVPGGSSPVGRLVDAFCSVVGWGSVQLINALNDPLKVVVPLLVIALVVIALVRRTSWAAVAPIPVVGRRRGGEILRAAIRLPIAHPRRMLVPALVVLPAAGVIAGAVQLLDRLPVIDDLVDIVNPTQASGLTAVFGAIATGSLGIGIAMTLMIAVIAWRLDDLERAESSSLRTTVVRLRSLARPLGVTSAMAIVPIWLVSLIPLGLPVALWWFVRWSLASVVVVREGLRGRAALARSAALIKGRFFSTMMIVSVVHGAVAVGGLVVGLAVLTTATALPLWSMTGVISAASVLIMPTAAAAVVMLYGDAVAEGIGADDEVSAIEAETRG